MDSPVQKLSRWAARLRFPNLVLLTGAVFVADLIVPDALPFVDELLLGLVTLILTRIRRPVTTPRSERDPGSSTGG